ncbi:S-layer homology domain-containing protein [Paenibacillus foliorum]|uniref:S-layer homology domain-containing protein n=1 Tax=Paenibacillus foliorum TaxID=2654974 RepID=UPI00149259F3|nr:S-layer homology domain-containing protein [Paenibacillus foliorum]
MAPVVTPPIPSAPSGLIAAPGDAQVSLAWNTVTGATYYRIYQSRSNNALMFQVSWFVGAVGAAAKAGIVTGFEKRVFEPNASITREQMAVMISLAMKTAGVVMTVDEGQLSSFTDAKSIHEWARDSLAHAVKAGIVKGVSDSLFVPEADATRAEAVVMIKRFLQYVKFMN